MKKVIFSSLLIFALFSTNAVMAQDSNTEKTKTECCKKDKKDCSKKCAQKGDKKNCTKGEKKACCKSTEAKK